MKRALFCLILTQLFSLSAFAGEWSLKDPSKGWDSSDLVRMYFHNSELQTQSAWEALSHYKFRGDEEVLDFGCGDGKLSALMSFMVPEGSVHGVDISESMISFASKMFPKQTYRNLSFSRLCDTELSDLPLGKQFDLITSYSVFHLIPNPRAVLEKMRLHMHPASKLVVTFLFKGSPEFIRLAAEEMGKRGWRFPPPTEEARGMRDPAKIKEYFERSGLSLEYFTIITTRTPYSTKEELIDWFEGTAAGNWEIPAEGRREFFTTVVERYLKSQPQECDDDGFVYLTCDRIDLVARPKD